MALAMNTPTSVQKFKPSDLRREAEAMIRDGSMPSMETVLQAAAGAREKYAEQIRVSRKVRTSNEKRRDN